MSGWRSSLAFSLQVVCLTTSVLLATCVDDARAGGGPENVFLLVNENSDDSKTIANHYIQIRKIPPAQVHYLNWTDGVEQISVELFRERIMLPAIAEMHRRGISEQIDYVIYSSDFPWLVSLRKEFGKNQPPRQLAPFASLTGLTYLWKFVAAKDRQMIGLRNNYYVQWPDASTNRTQSYGFRSWYGWGPEGQRLEAGGRSYRLSTMLAVTSGRGNTVDEVVRYLQRSAKADGTRPTGTVYIMKNGNIRSTTREWAFRDTVEELKQLGVKAEILAGQIPQRKLDVQGAVIGTSDFKWENSKSTILPGAICEHLTSMGGIMRARAGQTPLSEFLRFGAAGASGTVTEPYAIQDKFPMPSIHVHYARGCTLAEAFYQSVAGPYQLLIVGDPLCRPWARIPVVSISGIEPNQVLSETVKITPTTRIDPDVHTEHYELMLDGRRVGRCRPGESISLDTQQIADGYHEFCIVAVGNAPIQTQGRLQVPAVVQNKGRTVTLAGPEGKTIAAEGKLTLRVGAPGATNIVILQNRRALGQIAGESGELQINTKTLGHGPIRLQAVAIGGGQVVSKPLTFRVE